MTQTIRPLKSSEGYTYDDAHIYVEEIPTHGQKTITIVIHSTNTSVNTVFSYDAQMGDIHITRRPTEVEISVRGPLMSVHFFIDNYVIVEDDVGYFIETDP